MSQTSFLGIGGEGRGGVIYVNKAIFNLLAGPQDRQKVRQTDRVSCPRNKLRAYGPKLSFTESLVAFTDQRFTKPLLVTITGPRCRFLIRDVVSNPQCHLPIRGCQLLILKIKMFKTDPKKLRCQKRFFTHLYWYKDQTF